MRRPKDGTAPLCPANGWLCLNWSLLTWKCPSAERCTVNLTNATGLVRDSGAAAQEDTNGLGTGLVSRCTIAYLVNNPGKRAK